MSPSMQSRYFRPTGRKVAMALAIATLIGGASISPAFAQRGNEYGRGAPGGDHGQHAWHGNRHGYQSGYQPEYRPGYRPGPYYQYAEPIYVPPPVYYEPRQSPGISLFFPLDLRR